MRNSSLVKWLCAENVTGLKSDTEALDLDVILVFLTRNGIKVRFVEINLNGWYVIKDFDQMFPRG